MHVRGLARVDVTAAVELGLRKYFASFIYVFISVRCHSRLPVVGVVIVWARFVWLLSITLDIRIPHKTVLDRPTSTAAATAAAFDKSTHTCEASCAF